MLENLKNPCEGCSISWECSDEPDENCESYMIYTAQCSILRDVVEWLRVKADNYDYINSAAAKGFVRELSDELEQLLKEGKHESRKCQSIS